MKSIQRINRSIKSYNNVNDSKVSSGYVFDKVRNGEIFSSVDLHIGGTYIVEPDNPQKLKHRGRQCSIVEFEYDKIRNPIRCKVRFSDNNRTGMVELSDLMNVQKPSFREVEN